MRSRRRLAFGQGRALGGITKQSAAKKYQVLTDPNRTASAAG
ncbi:hypothetical protein [Kitasatospora sp. NPDC098663]